MKMVKSKTMKHLRIVSFDEEIINKDSAGQVLSKVKERDELISEQSHGKTEKSNEDIVKPKHKNKKRKNDKFNGKNNNHKEHCEVSVKTETKRKVDDVEGIEKSELFNEVSAESKDSIETTEKKIKRKKKNKLSEEVLEQPEGTDEVSVENPKVKTGESIRAQKRKKHEKLLEEKQLLSEQTAQQNALNYLSKWKHCRTEWKFEKLKQIWLQQNLFDINKIPNEFSQTVVEYFSESKGFIRKVVLRDALKIIENEEQATEKNTEENYLFVVQRARNIVQSLQE